MGLRKVNNNKKWQKSLDIVALKISGHKHYLHFCCNTYCKYQNILNMEYFLFYIILFYLNKQCFLQIASLQKYTVDEFR